jgi:two-component system nitrate/nitrite sensor histidine kinase NarX
VLVVLCLLAITGLLMQWRPDYVDGLWGLQLVLVLAGVLLIGLAILFMKRHLLEPLAGLRDWALRMQSGDLSARITEPVPGEFAELTHDINRLGEALYKCSQDMESLVHEQTERLAQKTRSLEILYDVATNINAARDLDDLLKRFLPTMQEVVDARAASVRLVTEDGQMRLVASRGLGDEVAEAERLLPLDRCLCGKAIAAGDIKYQEDIRQCCEVIGRPFFDDAGDVKMIAVPLQYRGRTMGVYNLFVTETGIVAREDIKELLMSIGRHLGSAIEKARLDDEAIRLSIIEERTRLAHELHDSLAQTLASLRFQVRVLDETLHQGDESALWQELERVENSLDEAHSELRHLIAHFRSPGLNQGLIPGVEELANRFRRETGMHIFLQNKWGQARFPADTEMQILRIVQESLNNVRKHSKAQTARVMLGTDGNSDYRVLVEDDGVGFDRPIMEGPPGEHIGLTIMQDRARQLGGELRIESERGEGTRVLLTFHDPGHETGNMQVLRQISK